ncbi:putative CXXCH cytochrome family protein [Neobacillus niacini]|uniref:cytochrome c3 family protein n=1 Tax=Neobacillus driksii TaxID=3035913 RepID=UPI002781DA37|nr:cytochrome c3 family protein [Neobacillus niacini]MDQ0975162.1 putative CXXCH cytochrome family protein [Neobacillus niacini]
MRKFSLSFLFALLLFSMFAIAASAQGELYNGENGEITPGVVGDNIENANDTAEGADINDGTTAKTVKKNLTGHNVHTSYQNNTNSCASCHQTHTSQGDQLLFADTVYNTCTACHDGTLGYLNVFADGKSAKTTGAGTFGGTHGSSQHMANDTITISAAPGGNPVSTSKTKGTMWGESFNCASCHAPHGSYSDRLLQYNPNGIGSMPASQGGNQLENVPVVDTLTGQTAAVVLLRTEDTTTGKVTVAQYNKGTSGYTKSTAPWLYGYDNRTNGLTYWSRLVKVNATSDADEVAAYGSTAGVYFDYEHAEAYSSTAAGATALKSATKGFIARPVVVQMAKEGHDTIQSAYWSGADISKFEGKTAQELKDLGYTVDASNVVKNVGVQMSKFCAACHTDYLQANSDGKKSHFGDETAAYRHSTNSDSYTCVRCHFGHGTDAYIMKDSLGRTIADLTATGGQFAGDEAAALSYMQDNNPSSALKKFTNMSVCWACHNSSHAETIKNAERRADHPVGMPGTN